MSEKIKIRLIILFFGLLAILVSIMWINEAKGEEPTISLVPHYDNYFVPASKYIIYDEQGEVIDEFTEAKFQISVKTELLNYKDWQLVVAFTQESWWDVYNKENSRPFRETNYNPQVFIRTPKWNGFQFDVGYWHESNGQTELFSRSWDRFFFESTWENETFVLRGKFWNVLLYEHEQMARDLGNFDGTVIIKFGDNWWTLNGGSNRGYISFSHPNWIFPNSLKTVYSYQRGKGDNQLQWDQDIERIGVGLMFHRR